MSLPQTPIGVYQTYRYGTDTSQFTTGTCDGGRRQGPLGQGLIDSSQERVGSPIGDALVGRPLPARTLAASLVRARGGRPETRPAQEVDDGRGDWRPSRLADAVEASEALRIVHVPLAVLLTTVSLIVEHPLNQPIVRERSGMRGVSPSPDQLERMGEILGGCDVIACISARVPSLAEEVFSWPDASRRFLQPTGSLPREATLTLAREATDIVMNLAELLILGRQAGLKVPDITEKNPEAPFRGAELLDRLRSRGIAACNVVVTLGPRGSLVADGLRHEVYFLALESVNSERKVDMQVGNGDRFLGSLIAYETAPGTSPDSGESQGRIVASALQATCFVAEKLGIPRDAYRVVPRRL